MFFGGDDEHFRIFVWVYKHTYNGTTLGMKKSKLAPGECALVTKTNPNYKKEVLQTLSFPNFLSECVSLAVGLSMHSSRDQSECCLHKKCGSHNRCASNVYLCCNGVPMWCWLHERFTGVYAMNCYKQPYHLGTLGFHKMDIALGHIHCWIVTIQ